MIIVSKNFSKFKNRGMELESILENTFKQTKYSSISLIEKYPTPIKPLETEGELIKKAIFKRPSALDFVGVFNKKHIEIEAKTTQNSRIFMFSYIKDHQIERIRKLEELKALTFIVIEFKQHERYFLLSGKSFLKYVDENKKSISLSELSKCSKELVLRPNLTLNIFDYIK